MFKRRIPKSFLKSCAEFFWPSMGWLRAFRYIKHRVIRMSDTTHKIASGLANGAVVSFTPLIGTHFLQALLLSYFLKSNYLASLIGTFWGNPWTFPFLWFFSYKIGTLIMSIFGMQNFASLPDEVTLMKLWDIIVDQPLKLFVPWAIGGYLCALLTWPLFYFIAYKIIETAQLARQARRLKKLHKESLIITRKKDNSERNNL